MLWKIRKEMLLIIGRQHDDGGSEIVAWRIERRLYASSLAPLRRMLVRKYENSTNALRRLH